MSSPWIRQQSTIIFPILLCSGYGRLCKQLAAQGVVIFSHHKEYLPLGLLQRDDRVLMCLISRISNDMRAVQCSHVAYEELLWVVADSRDIDIPEAEWCTIHSRSTIDTDCSNYLVQEGSHSQCNLRSFGHSDDPKSWASNLGKNS